MSDATPPPVGLDPESLLALAEAVADRLTVRLAPNSQGGLRMARTWTYQRPEQVRKKGADKAPWYAGWIDPDGNRKGQSCGPGDKGRRLAEDLAELTHAQLITGTYGKAGGTWKQFRKEFEDKIASGMARRTRDATRLALDHFERLCSPKRMGGVKTATVDGYRALRREEGSLSRPGAKVSPATVNKELRTVRAALRKALQWGYLTALPEFAAEREPRRLPRPADPDHFAALYRACVHARVPHGCQGHTAGDWWQALLACVAMSGWRIGAWLALDRADLDLAAGVVLTRSADNKGRRDQRVPLHPTALAHLWKVAGFTEKVFPWPHNEKTLRKELHRLQRLAGVPTDWGFHGLKRLFCTYNASRLAPAQLQYLAQHQSFDTTLQFYINPEAEIREAVGRLYVPEVLKGVS